MKKLLIALLIIFLCSASVAFGYVMGGSNLSFGGYPAFNAFLPYNPSRSDVERYVREAKEYVENGDNDIRRVREAQEDAIRRANDAVNRYNRGF